MIKTAYPSFADILLPLVLVLGAKYISVFIINIVLNLEWVFSFSVSQIFTLPFFQYSDLADLVLVNSISSLFMIMVLTIGYTVALYRFQFFHEDFIEPKVSANLHSQKTEYLIFKEARAHIQITVWFILACIIFLISLLEFLAGSMVLFVLSVNFVIVAILLSATVFDLHQKKSRKVKRR